MFHSGLHSNIDQMSIANYNGISHVLCCSWGGSYFARGVTPLRPCWRQPCLFFQYCFCKGLLKISLREGLFPSPILSHQHCCPTILLLVYTRNNMVGQQTGSLCKDVYLSCYIFHKIKFKIWFEDLEYPIIKQMFLFHSRKKTIVFQFKGWLHDR